jgi:hypothetical protein
LTPLGAARLSIDYGGFMKKVLGLTAVLFTALTIEAYAVGLGLQFGGNALSGFDDPGLSFLISRNEETHAAVTWVIKKDGLSLGGSVDFWVVPINITQLGPGNLKAFIGVGPYAQIAIWEDYFGLGAGLRLPIGVDWKAKMFDVFFQVVPRVGLGFLPSPGFDGLSVDLNLGARFWF